MIETKEQFDKIHDYAYQDMTDGLWICHYCNKPAGETDDCPWCQIGLLKETIEAMRPLMRLIREERIISVGNHVTACTFCDTSWLNQKDNEHHESNCIFFEIPRWLYEEEETG